MSTAQATKNCITLKGSAQIIVEYLSKYEIQQQQWKDAYELRALIHYGVLSLFIAKLEYGINSILFQRGIYPAENFDNTQQYGLTILMSKDPKIQTFLQNVLTQTEG